MAVAGHPDSGARLLRLTCYYYRKAYYRSFFWSPPACAVPDAAKRYTGETPLPVHSPEHPPLLLLAVAGRAGLPVVGRDRRVPLPDRLRHRAWARVIAGRNAMLLSLYSLSCHSCRYLCGGYLDSFHGKPVPLPALASHHAAERAPHASSPGSACSASHLTDLYVRLVAVAA